MTSKKKLVKNALKQPEFFNPEEIMYMQFWLTEHKRQKQIKKLKKLFDEDAITEEEYISQKDKLLNSKEEKNERSFIGKVFKYLFYAYNGLMAFWLISGLFSAGSDILNETNEYAAAGGAIGAGIGAFFIISIWIGGAVLLGIPTYLTRVKN